MNEKDINLALGIAWGFSPPDMVEFIIDSLPYWRGLLTNFPEWFLWTCQVGIQTALLVQKGSGGIEDVLDNYGKDIYILEKLSASPSPYYYVTNELNLKPWICSFGYMGGIELAINIVKEEKVNPAEIESVVFRGDAHYVKDDIKHIVLNTSPKDFHAAKFSMPWSFAMAILGYECGPEWFTEERFKDPTCIDLAKKVSAEAAESSYINEMEIRTKPRSYKRRIMRSDLLGSARRPMTQEQIESKFMKLASPVIGNQQTIKLLSAFRNFEELDDIRELTRYFAPA